MTPGCPLKLTAVTPVRPTPLTVTSLPYVPSVGAMLVTENVTVNEATDAGESPAPVCTRIGPVAAPCGTATFSELAVTFVGTLETPPPKSTRSAPAKPLPFTVITAPVAAEPGKNFVMVGSTVNWFAVVVVPPAFVTEIGPVTAAVGTVTFSCPVTSAKAAGTPPTLTDVVRVNVFPVNVTTVPVKPCVVAKGSSIVGNTLNTGPVAVPPGVTTVTAPDRAPAGTWVKSCVPSGDTESITALTVPNFTLVAPSSVVP